MDILNAEHATDVIQNIIHEDLSFLGYNVWYRETFIGLIENDIHKLADEIKGHPLDVEDPEAMTGLKNVVRVSILGNVMPFETDILTTLQ